MQDNFVLGIHGEFEYEAKTSEEVRQEKIRCMMYEETGGGYQQTLVSIL